MSHFDEFDQLGQNSNSSNLQFDLEVDPNRRYNTFIHIKRKPKPNTKNTYIKKISSLIKMSNQDAPEEKYQLFIHI